MKWKHGQLSNGRRSKSYRAWSAMRRRCLNPNYSDYPSYGGRGITICERWNSYANFLQDMGEAPSDLSLDRINNDGNYEPGNCRWATPQQQVLNSRTVAGKNVEFRGERKSVTGWARHVGMPPKTLYSRLANGWDIERALTTPRSEFHARIRHGEKRSMGAA